MASALVWIQLAFEADLFLYHKNTTEYKTHQFCKKKKLSSKKWIVMEEMVKKNRRDF